MGKKHIFINIHYLEIGGAETSLIGLLQALDPRHVDVDLFLNDHRGEMMQFIPEWVNVLPAIAPYTMIERPLKEVLRRRFVGVFAARMWAKWKFRQYKKKKHPIDDSAVFGYVGRYVTPVLPSICEDKEYDLAISFVTPHNIVLDKIKAKRKICWIHTDYSKIDVNPELEYPIWSGYDNIVSISPDVTENFCKIFPTLRDKIVEIENILSQDFVRQRADSIAYTEDMPRENGVMTLLTVGRYSYPKRLEEIPAICRRLIERGYKVKWYIIGYGGDGKYITDAIRENGMEDYVIMLGKKGNPYPYIKACDIYVQPSRYEGKSVVVREAQMLYKPVVVTAYPTAASQINNDIDGVIVPMDVEGCANGIAEVMKDTPLRLAIVEYLSVHEYGNELEIEKLYRLMA